MAMILTKLPTARATALIILASCSFGSLSTLTILITRRGFPLLPAMFWRYLLAAAVLLVVVRKSELTAIDRRQALRLMLIGGCGQAVITYFSLRALDFIPVGPLAFLFYTYPAWVTAIAAVTRREAITLPRLLALAIAMAGIVVMVGAPSAASLHPLGIMLALGTALLYALYLPALQSAQKGVPPLVSSFYLVAGVFVSFLVASVLVRDIRLPESLSLWAFLIMLSLVGTVLAFVSLIAGLRVLGPVRTSIIATIEPFFTALLGAILLSESLTSATIAGGAMIAAAVLMLQWNAKSTLVLEPAE